MRVGYGFADARKLSVEAVLENPVGGMILHRDYPIEL